MSETVDGLRKGMKELGFEEGKQFTLTIRDTRGDVKATADAAKDVRTRESELDICHCYHCYHRRKGSNAKRSHRFLHRQRSGRPGLGKRLCETWRETHRRSLFGQGSYGEASRDPQRNVAKDQPSRGVFRSHHQGCRGRSRLGAGRG